MFLYKLTFASGKIYIGQTVRKMHIRYQQHGTLARGGSLLPVHCAWRKHGEPVCDVIGSFDCQEDLNAAEVEAIASHGSLNPGGYNLALGGADGAVKSPIVRAKMSAGSMGILHTEETKAKIRAGMKRRWEDAEYRERVLVGVSGSFTLERRKAQAETARRVHTGRKVSDETKAKLRGRVFSEESRAKMSAAAKGRPKGPRSAETRAKLSASVKASHNGKARGAAISAALKARHAEMTEGQRNEFSEARRRAWATRRLKKSGEATHSGAISGEMT